MVASDGVPHTECIGACAAVEQPVDASDRGYPIAPVLIISATLMKAMAIESILKVVYLK